MEQITDILEDADKSPRSTNFSGKPLVPSANQLSLSVPAPPQLVQSLNASGREGSP